MRIDRGGDGGNHVAGKPCLEGEWMIELKPKGAPIIGLLQLERNGENWQAYVEGGPAPVAIDGDNIEVAIDSRDIRGFVFVMRLSGKLAGSQISGTYTVESEARVNVSDGVWQGARYTAVARPKEAKPVDMTGIWKPAPGIDFRKYTMDLTSAADAWLDDYLMHYDQPNVRCASPGITAMVAWGGYPFEILASDNRLTFIYEFDSEVRRVFMDGRKPPEFYQHSGMGFSTGRLGRREPRHRDDDAVTERARFSRRTDIGKRAPRGSLFTERQRQHVECGRHITRSGQLRKASDSTPKVDA